MRRVRSHFGVVEFDVFTQEIAADLMHALDDKLHDARGLIIDLRNNGGGEAEAMTEVASVFLPTGKSLGYFKDRSGRIGFEPRTSAAMLFAPDSIKSSRVPLIILTSDPDRSYPLDSAAIGFVACNFSAEPRIILYISPRNPYTRLNP